MRWNDRTDWVWSADQTHEPLITAETFAAAEEQRATASGRREKVVRKTRDQRHYVLSSLIFCGECGRRMEGAWSNSQPYYRCRPRSSTVEHSVRIPYAREKAVVGPLDEWLASAFDADHIDETCAILSAASEPSDGAVARAED